MEWEVTVKSGTREETYLVSAARDYRARVDAVGKFLEGSSLPGFASEYVSGKRRGILGISVKTAVDGRRLPRYGPSPGAFLEQVGRMRKLVREGELPEEKKAEVVVLLIKLEEVLGE